MNTFKSVLISNSVKTQPPEIRFFLSQLIFRKIKSSILGHNLNSHPDYEGNKQDLQSALISYLEEKNLLPKEIKIYLKKRQKQESLKTRYTFYKIKVCMQGHSLQYSLQLQNSGNYLYVQTWKNG